jgi:hypothetical protein
MSVHVTCKPVFRALLILVLLSAFVFISGAPTPVQAATSACQSATVGSDVYLGGTYMEVGIADVGSFGTTNVAPLGFHPGAGAGNRLGLSFDGDGWGEGSAPVTSDFFLPGVPEERFVIGYNDGGTNVNLQGARAMSDVDFTSLTNTDTSDCGAGVLSAVTTGTSTDGNVQFTQTVSFNKDSQFYRIAVVIENAGEGTLYDVRYLRTLDPDQDRITGSSSTAIYLDANPPTDSYAQSRADTTSLADPVSIFMFANDTRARASSNANLSVTDAYLASVWDSPTISCGSQGCVEDDSISIAFKLGDIPVGGSVSLVFYQALTADIEEVVGEITGGSTSGAPYGPPTISEGVELLGWPDANPVVVGDEIEWTFRITNTNSISTQGLSFRADVPEVLEILDVWASLGSERLPRAGQTVWVDIPPMAPGEVVFVTINTKLHEAATTAELIHNARARLNSSAGKGIDKAGRQSAGEAVCVWGHILSVGHETCTMVYPSTLPATGAQPVVPGWSWAPALIGVGLLAGWLVMRRRMMVEK